MSEAREVRASLGCGTLILIAIIVILFSGQRDRDGLETKIDELTKEVKELRLEIAKLRKEGGEP